MAIHVNVNGTISTVTSENLSPKKIAELMDTSDFLMKDMGVYIAIYSDDMLSYLNGTISLTLHIPVYGNAILVSGSELSDIPNAPITDLNSSFEMTESNNGIRRLLKDVLLTANLVIGVNLMKGLPEAQQLPPVVAPPKKDIYFFDPKKIHESLTANDTKFLDTIFNNLTGGLEETDVSKWTDVTIYEEPQSIIKIKPNHVKETLTEYKSYYLDKEDYLKCGRLQKLIDKL